MCFVEEEDQLRLFRIADFRQRLEQLGKQPEQEGRIDFRRLLHQSISRKDVDHAPALLISLDQVVQVQRWLAKKLVGALRLEREKVSLDRTGARGGDVAILGAQLL